jgi:hypothetical protein
MGVLVLVPSVAAHAYDGGPLVPDTDVFVEVNRDNPAILPLYATLHAGKPFLVNAAHVAGPGNLQVALEATDGALLGDWSLPGDNQTHTLSMVPQASIGARLVVRSDDPEWAAAILFYDLPCQGCESKVLPPWIPGDGGNGLPDATILFNYTVPSTGRFEVRFREPVYVSVTSRLVATGVASPRDLGDYVPLAHGVSSGADLPVHTLQWDAVAGQEVYLLVTGVKSWWEPPHYTPPDERWADAEDWQYALPTSVRPTWGPAPSQGIPSPFWLPLAALGLAFAYSKRKRSDDSS